jgi:hypothetical protein
MWQATNRNDDEPTAEALQTLHEELVRLDDEALLAQPYRVWSPTLDAMETVLSGASWTLSRRTHIFWRSVVRVS